MGTSRKPHPASIERHVSLERGGKIALLEDIVGRLRGNRFFTLTRHPDGLVELRPHPSHSAGTGAAQIALGQDNTLELPQAALRRSITSRISSLILSSEVSAH